MATIENWNKYMNLLHEYALVEYDLRELIHDNTTYDAHSEAGRILFERFV
jgi:hypothetical protein